MDMDSTNLTAKLLYGKNAKSVKFELGSSIIVPGMDASQGVSQRKGPVDRETGDESKREEQKPNDPKKPVDDGIDNVKQHFKTTMTPKKFSSGDDLSDIILSPGKTRIVAYKRGKIGVKAILASEFSEIKLPKQIDNSETTKEGIIQAVFGENDSTLYCALKNGKIVRKTLVDYPEQGFLNQEICLNAGREAVSLTYFSSKLLVSTAKGELIRLTIDPKSSPSLIKEETIIDRLSAISQICVSSGKNLYAYTTTDSQVRVYSTELCWLKFDKLYQTDLDSTTLIEFSRTNDDTLYVAYNKSIEVILTSDWRTKKILVSRTHNIQAMKITEDDAWMVGLCTDYSVVVWNLMGKELEPVFINQNIEKIIDYKSYTDIKKLEAKVIKKAKTNNDKFYSLEVDCHSNKIYSTSSESKEVLCWSGPFLDKITLKISDFNKKDQKLVTIDGVDRSIAIVSNSANSRLCIWDLKDPSLEPIRYDLQQNKPREIPEHNQQIISPDSVGNKAAPINLSMTSPNSKPPAPEFKIQPLCLQVDITGTFMAVGYENRIDVLDISNLKISTSGEIKCVDAFVVNGKIQDLAFDYEPSKSKDPITENSPEFTTNCFYYCCKNTLFKYLLVKDKNTEINVEAPPIKNPIDIKLLKEEIITSRFNKLYNRMRREEESAKNENQIVNVVTFELDTVIIGCDSGTIFLYDIKTLVMTMLSENNYPITSIVVFKDKANKLTKLNKFITSCSEKPNVNQTEGENLIESFFIVWSAEDKCKVKITKVEFKITSLYLSKDEHELVVCTQDGRISVYNLPGFVKILSLYYSNTKKKKAVKESVQGPRNHRESLINITKYEPPYETDKEQANSDNPEAQSSANDASNTVASVDMSTNKQLFSFANNEALLVVSNDNGVYISKSPLDYENLRIYGFPINVREIYVSLLATAEQLKQQYEGKRKFASSWVIGPYTLNLSHLFAFRNLNDLLKQELVNKGMYLQSDFGFPINITLEKDNIESSGVIIAELRKRIENDIYALESLNDVITQLNEKGFKGLDELYKACLVPNFEINTINCDESESLPIVIFTTSPLISEDKFEFKSDVAKAVKEKQNPQISIAEEGKKGQVAVKSEEGDKKEVKNQRVKFFRSCLRLNLALGSSDSIKFLNSIMDCQNTDIFETKYIKSSSSTSGKQSNG